jgi:hypothetical protein
VNFFVPEFLCAKARELRETFGTRSRGVPLRETPDSVLQFSSTTPGAERHVTRKKG